jgi:hypothetical protein
MADIVMLNKSLFGVGKGWDYRTLNGVDPKSIIVHTTNGARFSKYTSEANYIYTTPKISAHYLVGKQGQITQFLNTTTMRAWHAGAVNDPRFNNNNSIGIEVHYTPGEGFWTEQMRAALTWLVQQLVIKHSIKIPDLVDTHRRVAIPKGRKIDPSGFPDSEFYVWRNRIFTEKPEITPFTKYRVIVDSARVRTSPRIADNIVGRVTKGDIIESEATKVDENLAYVNGINTWAHLTRGMHNGIAIDGLGFVHTSNLTIVG